MTIRMLKAWNGLHQQKIVTTLSGSDEAALVAAGIATYDLDGPAENLRMAQLATDAAGNVVGLQVGSQTVMPASPSSSAMILKNSGGVLVVDGVAVREIGVCAYQLLTDYLAGTNQDFLTEIPLIAQAGFRFIRVMGGPIWPSEWTATYGTDKAVYFAKIKKFLDYAAQYNLGIVLSVFWRHATQSDLASEVVSMIGASGSATRTRCATIIQEYASNFSAHPAFAAWEIGNEYSLMAANGSLPTGNVGKGTPASYAAPQDQITLQQMRDFYTFVATTIRIYDATGRAIFTGNGGPGGVLEKGIETYRTLVPLDNPDPVDTLLIHKYSRNEFGNRAYADLADTLAEMQSLARTYRKPFVLGEFGMERNETYGGYGGDAVFQAACEAIYRSGIQIAFAWNWKQDTGTGSNNFNFHPLNTANGTNTKAEILKAFQAKMLRDNYSPRIILPMVPEKRTGKNIYVPAAAGTPTLLSAADAASLKPTWAFAVSFWVRQTRGDLINRRIARKYGGNAGWYIGLDASNPDRTVFMQLQYSDGATQNLGGQCQQIPAGVWRHYVFQFDSNSGNGTYGLSCFENGRWVKTLTPTAGKTWNPSTDLLYFFGDSGPSNVSYVGIKDFRLHNRALTDVEVRNLYMHDISPLSTVVGEWLFNNGISDTSGNGNNLTVVSGTPVYEDFSG